MAATKKAAVKSKVSPRRNNALQVPQTEGESPAVATARALLAPDFRHGVAAEQLFKAQVGDADFAPGIGDYAEAFKDKGKAAASGDLAFASRMLAAQAMTLDNIFAEMARRMALNMGEYLSATETYARIALKAQAGSRATLDVLAKLHQPREQTVRHVHVNEGGQAVIADEFHHHQPGAQGGQENGQAIEQPHATGTCAAGAVTALPSPDPFGNGVPLPSGKGQPAVQDARGQG